MCIRDSVVVVVCTFARLRASIGFAHAFAFAGRSAYIALVHWVLCGRKGDRSTTTYTLFYLIVCIVAYMCMQSRSLPPHLRRPPGCRAISCPYVPIPSALPPRVA
eukprot:9175495-Alexandrium_andersonii.AAC.1